MSLIVNGLVEVHNIMPENFSLLIWRVVFDQKQPHINLSSTYFHLSSTLQKSQTGSITLLEIKNKEDAHLLSTVRIEVESKEGSSTGTGFICSLADKKYGDLTKVYYLVTNKHVIRNGTKITLKMHTLESEFKKNDNDNVHIDLSKQQEASIEEDLNGLFFFHPKDDVDIAILNMNQSFFKEFLPLIIPIEIDKAIPDKDSNDVEIYDDITFIGYPNGLYDKKNLLPIIRKGSFATPYQVDFDGHPIFLIDASVFPGSSGSPVFLFDRKRITSEGKKINLTKPRIYFLGIVARVYHRPELLDLLEVKDIKAYGQQMIDVGVVYKAVEIRKLIKFCLTKTFFNSLKKDFDPNIIDNEVELDGFLNLFLKKQES